MSSLWRSVIVAVAGAFLMAPVTRWLGFRVQGLVYLLTGNRMASVYAYYALVLPGTVLHEGSHWAVARLLGVRATAFSLMPVTRSERRVQLGAVTLQGADPLRASLIGLAPLVSGTVAVLMIGGKFGLMPGAMASLDGLGAAWLAIRAAPGAWLWLYLLLAISNAMFPSASDRAAWGVAAIWAGILLIALYLLGVFSRLPSAERWLSHATQSLTLAFAVAAVLDLALGAVLWAVTECLGWLLGRRLVWD
jgi:hypothetical protein